MSVCAYCQREMLDKTGCTAIEYVLESGERVKRVPFGQEDEDWGASRGPCHDCAASVGAQHHPGCDVERCPLCGGQAFCCDCSIAHVVIAAPA
jgi:hypothetical protein